MTVQRAPGYWQNESGPHLRPAIERLLTNQMILADIPLIRAYFDQWICSGVWDENPHAEPEYRARLRRLRADVAKIATTQDVYRYYSRLVDEGLDPI